MTCKIGNRILTHEFLYIPECPLPLNGWDLLNKLGAQITSRRNKIQVHIPQNNAWEAQVYMLQESKGIEDMKNKVDIPSEIMDALVPFLWATENPVRAKSAEPVKVELK